MFSSLLDNKAAAPQAKAANRHPSVPRHLAVVLNAGAEKSPSLQEAASALEELLRACAETGVAVLTLFHPVGEKEIFEAALAGIQPAIESARAAGTQLNVQTPRDGREELLEAVRSLSVQASRGELDPGSIDAQKIEAALSTHALPAVDLLISTGGGMRLSGALLWQCAYAELLFSATPWFKFSRGDLEAALLDYASRCRKFGGLAG